MRIFYLLVVLVLSTVCSACEGVDAARETAAPDTSVVRVATFNIEDVRTADVLDPDQPRLREAAAMIQHIRPDILLINEMTYDYEGAPNVPSGERPGRNGQRFADNFLAVSQGDGLEPLSYRAFSAPTNTGVPSGLDLDNDGRVVDDYPDVPPASADGSPAPQTAEERAYGNDAWGFGVYPGQYGMTLLVRDGLQILEDSVRTFRLLPWSRMPGAESPVDPNTDEDWYGPDEWASFRMSSKSHWDVPVRLGNGAVLHVLASHPTPPAFDGPEQRNVRRNRAEIRFWADYLSDADYIEDDSSRAGGLAPGAYFVIVGDQNADPDEGTSLDNPIGTLLLSHPRINGSYVPRATAEGEAAYPDLDPDDTAQWGLRADYVLPSSNVVVAEGGIYRPVGADTTGVQVSDHFPVWLDLAVPSRGDNEGERDAR